MIYKLLIVLILGSFIVPFISTIFFKIDGKEGILITISGVWYHIFSVLFIYSFYFFYFTKLKKKLFSFLV